MHPYIPYLIADIVAAHRPELPATPERAQSIEEDFEEVERWVSGEEPAHTFGYYCGLEVVNFPPAEQLTKQEMKLVCDAFRKMMFSWNIDISLPEKLPLPIAYQMMVDTLDSKTQIVNFGCIGFDYCTGYAPDCVFAEYCPCLEFWNKPDDEDFGLKEESND